MGIEDYAGQRIRLRAEVREARWRSGRFSGEYVLVLDDIYHAATNEFLCDGRTVVFPKAARRDDIAAGCTIEFDANISRPRGSDYSAVVKADNFEVV
jgi:hypothetical protein